jgi:RPA family protein
MKIMHNEKFTRQPALRLFAAELAESRQTIIERVEGRDFDSHQQLTPTGVKVKRVFMIGALVEVDNVGTSGEILRGRIVDPTGVFTVYAGRYQSEALLSLSNLNIPCFVAVVGKTNTYRPDEETTIVSIRPETIVEIDAKTRDHWVVETATKTMERVEKSQLPEVEKEKYRQICKDALTKLVYLPHDISTPIETAKEILGIDEEKLYPSHQASTFEKNTDTDTDTDTEHESMKSMDALFTQQASSVEELPKSKNEIFRILPIKIKDYKESKTKSNDPIKARIRKKKIKQETVIKSQKTLFTEA